MNPTTIKHRKKTHELLTYEALFRWILPQYRQHKTIVSEYKREKAGYDGERNVDYKIATYPQKDFFVLQGIRLQNPPFYFQIDTLILSKRVLFILEIKNKQGTFRYDSKQGQLTQEVSGQTKSYKDPILQAEAQKTNMQIWLERRGFFNIPIETLVVVAYPSTIIENIWDDPDVYNKIIHNESLHHHLDRLNHNYTENITTNTQLKKLSHTLLQEDSPLRVNILQDLNIKEKHLIKGIPCEKCGQHPMSRLYKKWRCPNCFATSFKAHERKILDYFLFHGTAITNKKCRNLLQINSPKTAQTILNSMHLQQEGQNRGRKYLSPGINDFPQHSIFPYKSHSKQILQFD